VPGSHHPRGWWPQPACLVATAGSVGGHARRGWWPRPAHFKAMLVVFQNGVGQQQAQLPLTTPQKTSAFSPKIRNAARLVNFV